MEQIRALPWDGDCRRCRPRHRLSRRVRQRAVSRRECPCGDAVYVRKWSATPRAFSTGVLIIEVDVRLGRPGARQHDARDGQSADDAMNARGFSLDRAAGDDGHHAGGHERHVQLHPFGAWRLRIDLEHTDMQQRARVSMDALFRDLVMAGAGLQSPAVAPFRRGSINPDMPARRSPIACQFGMCRRTPRRRRSRSRMRRRVDAAGVPQLTRYDGAASEMPLVDQVADLRFEYFDADGQLIAMDRFADGPWVPDAVAADRFDADLQAIRRVRAFVRLRPARTSRRCRSPTSKSRSMCRREI